MTNLIISRRCNQSCSYCFAGDSAAETQPVFMSDEMFQQCLDFLNRSDIHQARFLGGEPTLHPRFAEFVQKAREQGKTVIVFTNGLMPESALSALEALPFEQCSVVLNASATGKTGEAAGALEKRAAVLRRLGQKAQLGFTIDRPDTNMDFLIQWIVDTGCKRAVRVGLSQPVLSGKNAFFPLRFYPFMAEKLLHFAEQAASKGIRIELDCGFVRCMFTDRAVARLEALGAKLGWVCSPVLDIDQDGQVIHCFPLSEMHSIRLDGSANGGITAACLRERFESRTAPYRQTGVFKECANCQYKLNQICSGGCLAHIIRRFSTEPIRVSVQYGYPVYHPSYEIRGSK